MAAILSWPQYVKKFKRYFFLWQWTKLAVTDYQWLACLEYTYFHWQIFYLHLSVTELQMPPVGGCWAMAMIMFLLQWTMYFFQLYRNMTVLSKNMHLLMLPVRTWSLSELWLLAQVAKFKWPTWGPPGSCRPQVGPCWPHKPCYVGGDGMRV